MFGWGKKKSTYWEHLSDKPTIEVIQGDITVQTTDAVVNAASKDLALGGTVDKAIKQGAGPELVEALKVIGTCPTGSAIITYGFKLPAKYIIHTAGPIYGQEGGREADLLASCYKSCLELAETYQLHSIAFPSISTGIYGYPIKEAAEIAGYTTGRYFFDPSHAATSLQKIIFTLYAEDKFQAYQEVFQKVFQDSKS